jgi:hypothetical protein
MTQWLTSAEAAAILRVKPSTLAKWRQLSSNGCFKGPPFSAALGRDARYRRSDLDAWLEEGMAHSTVEAKLVRAASRRSRRRSGVAIEANMALPLECSAI